VYIPTHIAAFHTLFNVVNTVIFLSLMTQFETLIRRLLPDKAEADDGHDLVYLESPFGSTPEIAIEAAAREVDRMAGVTENMVSDILVALQKKEPIDDETRDKLLMNEELTDTLEHKITEYLAALVHGHLSTASSHEALSLLSMINDLERIGDHGAKVALLLTRLRESETEFSAQAYDDLMSMAGSAADVISRTRTLILHRDPHALEPALERERALDALRDDCRAAHLKRLSDRECDAMAGLIFSDLLTSFEKMGDHAFNVVQATLGHKVS
jgi:phosphate:Na+ symporter